MTTAAFAPAGGMLTARVLRRPGRPIFRFAARPTRLHAATLFRIGCRTVRDSTTGYLLSLTGCGDAR